MNTTPTYQPGVEVVAYGKHNAVVIRAVEDENGEQWFYQVRREDGFGSIVGESSLRPYAAPTCTIEDLAKGYIRRYRMATGGPQFTVEIAAVYASKNRVKARVVNCRETFMIDMAEMAAFGGSIEE